MEPHTKAAVGVCVCVRVMHGSMASVGERKQRRGRRRGSCDGNERRDKGGREHHLHLSLTHHHPLPKGVVRSARRAGNHNQTRLRRCVEPTAVVLCTAQAVVLWTCLSPHNSHTMLGIAHTFDSGVGRGEVGHACCETLPTPRTTTAQHNPPLLRPQPYASPHLDTTPHAHNRQPHITAKCRAFIGTS